jgi:signal transduction histidine kinase
MTCPTSLTILYGEVVACALPHLYLESMRGKTASAWLFLGALFVLCAVLGLLQYRWIGEINVALRDRLRGTLHASLFRASQDLNAEISSAARSILPAEPPPDPAAVERALLANVDRNLRVFQRIAVAEPHGSELNLRILDPQHQSFRTEPWPANWERMHTRLLTRLTSGALPGMQPGDDGLVYETPVMSTQRGNDYPRREIAWIVFELNVAYIRETVLPEIFQRDLDAADYQLEVADRDPARTLIYQSDPAAGRIDRTADAQVGMLEINFFRGFGMGRGRPGGGGGRGGPGAPGGPPPEFGRWTLYARHRAGSLEAAVARVRARNLAVAAGVLLLLAATAGALVSFTRRAQRLAGLQMDFVAGVSHELRTPLTVIHTAAYNLRGKTATNPTQVERYGALIQQESARLKDLVEQVLRYAGASSGKVIREPEPLSLADVLADAVAAGKPEIEMANGTVEANVDADLPAVMGDPLALKHAFGNLLSNAAKYGVKEHGWVGVYASRGGTANAPEIEVRVADRGPGIPADEQRYIFDPFFRGKRAIADQIHGTGLGLNLVKKIVEAHGGSIRVKSELTGGTEFVVRLPAIANGGQA